MILSLVEDAVEIKIHFENFTGMLQSNYELGYALKFVLLITLVLTHFLNYWGFAIGVLFGLVLICVNKNVNGERSYLYPLIPFNKRALTRLVFRLKKP